MKTITEAPREVAVIASYDVVVAGGGFAGISAALAAARQGARVCLIEREWAPGGLGTLGLVTIYLPLCDGRGHQVIAGIGEELMRLCVKHGAETDHMPSPDAWLNGQSAEERAKTRYQAQYNPCLFALEAERLLLDSGVDIRYGTLVCGGVREPSRVEALIIEDKGGRFAVRGAAFVDATGDADVCRVCGLPVAAFAQGNVLAAWYYSQQGAQRRLNMLGFSDIPNKYKDESAQEKQTAKRYTGLTGDDLSEMTVRSHQTLLARLAQPRDGAAETITAMASIPQIRMTRRLDGDATPDDDSFGATAEDSIGMCGDWRKPGPVYELPYGMITSRTCKNVFAAGRCVSVTDAMWDITRVIPVCAVTGQAAGTAAAMLRQGAEVSVPELQRRLREAGVLLHRAQAR